MDWRPIQITPITLYLSKAHNWKSPGNDQIQNYWLKSFPATHKYITKKRKLLTIHGQHHPKSDEDRLYVPRKQGGTGLMQLEAAHAVEITKLWNM